MTYLVDHEGVTSFKLFMAYPGVFYSDDGQILRAMQTASESGATIMMHAENGIAIDVLVQQHIARGDTDPKYHSYSRPSLLEGEATNRAIVLSKVAGNVPLYIVHMSASEALNALAEARHDGLNVFGETCPQYLYMTLEDHLARPGFEGAKFVCSPPIRSKHDKHDHHGDLWKGLRMNELAIVSTDHCPFCFKDQKELGIGNFSKIPNGMGGVEHRMELINQASFKANSRLSVGSKLAAPLRLECSACTRKKGSLRLVQMLTFWFGIRIRRQKSALTISTT